MAHIRIARPYSLPEREATPEEVFLDRRRFLRTLGTAGLGAIAGLTAGGLLGCSRADESGARAAADSTRTAAKLPSPLAALYPAARNPKYVLDRPLTDEKLAARYNNFYEFTEVKDQVWKLAAKLTTRPWTLEIKGLVEQPRTIDVDDLVRQMRIEERLYRHRCVEAWSMAVPWTGFPLADFVRFARPLSSARYVRLASFMRPAEAPGQKHDWYPWPYYEGLTMAEATNELALLATGIYGHELPPQHGAPIRLVTPWKYGFKSIKSIVLVEFTDQKPHTFWNDEAPAEYDFTANVNPEVPHPRWSQATEQMIGELLRRKTLPYNGYGDYVAKLYA
jgi:sulfoxide reductase catalytic subunit YedY